MKTQLNDSHKFWFIWRNPIASYCPVKKEFYFDSWNLKLVPWASNPSDMLLFINWLENCQEHKDNIVYTSCSDGSKRFPELYSIEIY